MTLTTTQALVIAGAVTLGTIITRFLPFLLFPDNKPIPKVVEYLGRTLPAAMMGGVLSAECGHRRRAPRPAGADRPGGGDGAAPVEAQRAAVHRRGHSGLYGAGSGGFCLIFPENSNISDRNRAGETLPCLRPSKKSGKF